MHIFLRHLQAPFNCCYGDLCRGIASAPVAYLFCTPRKAFRPLVAEGLQAHSFASSLPDRLRLEEREQILVDLVLEGRAHAVRRALVDLQRGALDDLGREQGRGADRHDLVVVAVQDQGRHVEFLEILGQVRLGKRLDAEVRGREAGHHPLEPE